MAKKTKKISKKTNTPNDSNVVRIRASKSESDKPKTAAKTVTKTSPVKTTEKKVSAKAVKPKKSQVPTKGTKLKKLRPSIKAPRLPRFLRAFGGYFKGAWVELRQVRWPNRRATWGMTAAVLTYTAFFVIFVLLLDAGFKYLFELILTK
ncbi:preprotein translocase subunit SecE [Candidatus Saccharibacteria bacterium]|nr:preprotein translocase subunit SecE [Candidatus Saccharibacteria bacterium]